MNEAHLIHRIQQGDTDSFRHLYRLHALSAWQMAISVCKNKSIAEEAVQQSFINAYKYLHTFRNESSFKTWLLRIVLHECVRTQKLENKFKWQDLNDDPEQEHVYMSASDHLSQKEMKEQVAKTIEKLSEKESAVLTLFYIEELSIKETAEVLNFSESNVKVLLHRARKNFKYEYEKW